MNETTITQILTSHQKWIEGAPGFKANLTGANLIRANLTGANLFRADLTGANLTGAILTGANLDTSGLVKIMGVEIGNFYWKRIGDKFENNGYQFRIGLNKLKIEEKFNSDERELCGYPGFHFASRSWCSANYGERIYEAKIRIPDGAQICEPWATDGKASADMIEIVQVIDSRTGVDVTNKFKSKKKEKRK